MDKKLQTDEEALFKSLCKILAAPRPVDFGEAWEQVSIVYYHVDALIAEPALLTDRVLSALSLIARNSPFADIDDPGSDLHHSVQTPAQEPCLLVIEQMARLAYNQPAVARRVIAKLEDLAANGRDWDQRMYAVTYLRQIAAETSAAGDAALAVLERQQRENSDTHIRARAAFTRTQATPPQDVSQKTNRQSSNPAPSP